MPCHGICFPPGEPPQERRPLPGFKRMPLTAPRIGGNGVVGDEQEPPRRGESREIKMMPLRERYTTKSKAVSAARTFVGHKSPE